MFIERALTAAWMSATPNGLTKTQTLAQSAEHGFGKSRRGDHYGLQFGPHVARLFQNSSPSMPGIK